MKNFIKENWFKLSILILFVVFFGIFFCWFELRPQNIRIECYTKIKQMAEKQYTDSVTGDEYYKQCLWSKGINK